MTGSASDQDDRKPPRARRPRLRYAPDDGGGRMSRPLLVALIIVLAAGAFLLWPRGGNVPTGIGEQVTVVTAPDTTAHERPHSGDVDIQEASHPVVAEKPAGTSPSAPSTSKPAATKPTKKQPTATARAGMATGGETIPAPAKATPQPGPVITPTNDGPYALQLGSFSSETNAQKVRDQYLQLGYPVHVRAASTSEGAIVYRVWVGFFASRQEAQSYAKGHAPELTDTIAVHR